MENLYSILPELAEDKEFQKTKILHKDLYRDLKDGYQVHQMNASRVRPYGGIHGIIMRKLMCYTEAGVELLECPNIFSEVKLIVQYDIFFGHEPGLPNLTEGDMKANLDLFEIPYKFTEGRFFWFDLPEEKSKDFYDMISDKNGFARYVNKDFSPLFR